MVVMADNNTVHRWARNKFEIATHSHETNKKIMHVKWSTNVLFTLANAIVQKKKKTENYLKYFRLQFSQKGTKNNKPTNEVANIPVFVHKHISCICILNFVAVKWAWISNSITYFCRLSSAFLFTNFSRRLCKLMSHAIEARHEKYTAVYFIFIAIINLNWCCFKEFSNQPYDLAVYSSVTYFTGGVVLFGLFILFYLW